MISFKFFLLSIVILLLWVSENVTGQFYADDAITTQTSYLSDTPNDMVFCFEKGSPMVIRYDFSVADATFVWYQHNVEDNSWDNVLNASGNQLSVKTQGGYRVVVEDEQGNIIADERCWVYNTQEITNAEAEITFDDCFGVELTASADTEPLIFYDPVDGSSGAVDYELTFEWVTLP
ncbi:MAG: hypothetical protein ACOC2E_00750, partial [Bacteroidota bacterium]